MGERMPKKTIISFLLDVSPVAVVSGTLKDPTQLSVVLKRFLEAKTTNSMCICLTDFEQECFMIDASKVYSVIVSLVEPKPVGPLGVVLDLPADSSKGEDHAANKRN